MWWWRTTALPAGTPRRSSTRCRRASATTSTWSTRRSSSSRRAMPTTSTDGIPDGGSGSVRSARRGRGGSGAPGEEEASGVLQLVPDGRDRGPPVRPVHDRRVPHVPYHRHDPLDVIWGQVVENGGDDGADPASHVCRRLRDADVGRGERPDQSGGEQRPALHGA